MACGRHRLTSFGGRSEPAVDAVTGNTPMVRGGGMVEGRSGAPITKGFVISSVSPSRTRIIRPPSTD